MDPHYPEYYEVTVDPSGSHKVAPALAHKRIRDRRYAIRLRGCEACEEKDRSEAKEQE